MTCATSILRKRAASTWPCSLSVTTTTRKAFIDLMTRPFTIHPDPVHAACTTLRVCRRPSDTGISFFCQYYLRLHPRRRRTIGKSPDGETTNAHVAFVHGRLVRAYSVVGCCRHMQLQRRARPH